ncbi:PIG-L family deacetylase [Ruficoccus amylovorans]|uniref:PIG-L family deacetylase n=1 Tax=Ruficoccus amylovorans TaxID=1804625 RepID=A0A842HBN2_9BACT|nr:PIG-L deacetylase family protein [Ruficoccus amylovorans]MBC2593478.1 PIG-L family deacetylase [Ruficoccus amylovorans]
MNKKSDYSTLPSKLRILLIGAHPTDAFDNAGGTLIHHIDRGDDVTCVVMTHGVRSHSNVLLDEILTSDVALSEEEIEEKTQFWAREKNREVVDACEIMGIKDLRFLVMEDDIFLITPELVRKLGSLILDLRPDVIITHYPFEGGGIAYAHATTAHATLHAIHYASTARQGDSRKIHRTPQLYYMGIPSAGVALSSIEATFHPKVDFIVDCSDTMDRKVRALDQIRSQRYAGPYARKRIETVDGHFGRLAGMAYAEPFMRHTVQVCHYLPFTVDEQQRGNETQTDRFARMTPMVGQGIPYEETSDVR